MDAGLARPADDEMELAELLDSLANPTRLALLRQLRRARAMGEIRIRAEQPREGLPDERPMARQGVRLHLHRLMDSGFVRRQDGWRGELAVEEYVVQHQRLFALAEEVRRLGTLRPETPLAGDETSEIGGAARAPLPTGPVLVIVHGLNEGRAFSLGGEGHEWIVGREWGLPVCLDYDPFVSGRHARVTRDAQGRVQIEDLPGNTNGTLVNWAPLPHGRAAMLAHGDIVGVGKSLLLFRA